MGEPFRGYRTEVAPEWVDRNGHMHDAAYATVLSDANEELFGALGLSWDYRDATDRSWFTVEFHIRYLAECSRGQRLSSATTLVYADQRKLHLYTELEDEAGRLVASGESFYLHVEVPTSRVVPLSEERLQPVLGLLAEHADLPRPAHLGRGVATSRPAHAEGPA